MTNIMPVHPDGTSSILTPDRRYARLIEIADAGDTSDEGLGELVRLLFGPDAELTDWGCPSSTRLSEG